MTQPGEMERPPGRGQRGRPAARLHLRDRAAGLAQLLGAARAGTTGAGR